MGCLPSSDLTSFRIVKIYASCSFMFNRLNIWSDLLWSLFTPFWSIGHWRMASTPCPWPPVLSQSIRSPSNGWWTCIPSPAVTWSPSPATTLWIPPEGLPCNAVCRNWTGYGLRYGPGVPFHSIVPGRIKVTLLCTIETGTKRWLGKCKPHIFNLWLTTDLILLCNTPYPSPNPLTCTNKHTSWSYHVDQ